jgi:hypothetical protein
MSDKKKKKKGRGGTYKSAGSECRSALAGITILECHVDEMCCVKLASAQHFCPSSGLPFIAKVLKKWKTMY